MTILKETAWNLNMIINWRAGASPPSRFNCRWKNHFSEMKGDVGMSVHEKEGEQVDA